MAEARGRVLRHGAARVHRRRSGPGDVDRQRRRSLHHGGPGHDFAGLRDDRGRHRLLPRPHLGEPHKPAVTVGLAATGKFPWRDVPSYIGAQAAGATAGALAIVGVLGPKAHELGLGVASFNKALGVGNVQGFFAEFVGTFILVFVIFGVIHRKATPGFAGVAIGLVVFAAILPVAPATSAAINPARVFGPMLILQFFGGSVHWAQLPVYIGAELLAGLAAAGAYNLISEPRVQAAVDLSKAGAVVRETAQVA